MPFHFQVDAFLEGGAKGTKVVGAHSMEEMVAKLKKPRRVMMLVKAGQPVDDFIDKLVPLLDKVIRRCVHGSELGGKKIKFSLTALKESVLWKECKILKGLLQLSALIPPLLEDIRMIRLRRLACWCS